MTDTYEYLNSTGASLGRRSANSFIAAYIDDYENRDAHLARYARSERQFAEYAHSITSPELVP